MIVGILGGGQLARMLILAGYPLGLRFRVLDPDPECPAASLAEMVIGEYDDDESLAEFARGVDVVTYEFENVPAHTARWLTNHVPVFPPALALDTSQDRIAEKSLFETLNIPTTRYMAVDQLDETEAAVARIGIPSVLKTRRMGYDGKGQSVIRSAADVLKAWNIVGLGRGELANLIVESYVPFSRELSIIAVRARDGQTAFYPAAENQHSRGILSRSQSPTRVLSSTLQRSLESAAADILSHLNYVGVLAIEFFELASGELIANEMAPRVHNSGHWTIEGSACSQFENHIRAVAGLPLGSTAPRHGATSVMYNIIGNHPPREAILAIPGVHLHDYGKFARPGRKLGHVTVCETDAAQLTKACERVEAILAASGSRP